jgi:hypothetical protein
MPRYMIEDTKAGFRITLMQQAGFDEDTYTKRSSYEVPGSHSRLASAYSWISSLWDELRSESWTR